MITLVASIPAWGLPCISPFSNKVDAYLRMARIPHKLVSDTESGINLPKGKLPVLIHDEKVIPDSAIIFEYLNKTFDDPLDFHLDSQQRAIARAFSRMMDESFSWHFVEIRYRRDDNFWLHYAPVLRQLLKEKMPTQSDDEIEGMVTEIRHRVLDQYHAQGRGRHTEQEIQQFAKEEISAVATILGDRNYIFNDKPSSLDAQIFAFFRCVLKPPFESPIREVLRNEKPLSDYTHRFEEELYR